MTEAENDALRPGRAHPKPSKRWCKGKVGVEHVTEVRVPVNAHRQDCDPARYEDEKPWADFGWEVGCVHVEECVNCGKHVRPFLNKGECPTRVNSPEKNGNNPTTQGEPT
jgi:hypothetical protein